MEYGLGLTKNVGGVRCVRKGLSHIEIGILCISTCEPGKVYGHLKTMKGFFR